MYGDRFKVLENPIYGNEIVGNTPDGPVFDLGVDLENFVGPIYIKVSHVQEMATTVGMVNENLLKESKAENERLRARVRELEYAEEFIKNVRDLANRSVPNSGRGIDFHGGLFNQGS